MGQVKGGFGGGWNRSGQGFERVGRRCPIGKEAIGDVDNSFGNRAKQRWALGPAHG